MHRLWIVILAGCGRINFAPLSATGDAGDGGGGGGEMPPGPLTYRDAVLEDKPVAYWRLSEAGGTALDEVGAYNSSYIGTACTYGLPGALKDDPSSAIQFGGSDCYVDVGSPPLFNNRAPFSFELWASIDAPGAAYQGLVMSELRQGSAPTDGYALVDSATGVYLERAGGSTNRLTASYQAAAGLFTYYAGVYDGTTLELFVDGATFAKVTAVESMTATGARLSLAAFSPQTPMSTLLGLLDEVAIYDHVLPAPRIALHFDIGKNGPQ